MTDLPKITNVANYIRWNKVESSEALYKQYYNIDIAPKCDYCDDLCEYDSFTVGYKKYCNFNKHSEIIRKEALIKRKITLDNISHNIVNYDEFIFKNMRFYLANDYPKNDLFDGKYIRNITKIRNKSNSNLNFFNVTIKCVCCDEDIIYNVFNSNKLYCNKKKCITSINYNEEYIDICLLYEFNIQQYSQFKKFNKLNLMYNKINELYIKYGFNITKQIISGYCIEYNDKLLYRKYLKYDFSLLKNNIIEDKMVNICRCCGKSYIYKDIFINDNKNIYEKVIAAEYSCGKKECYHYILTQNLYYRDMSSQSTKLKEKILSGEFTPPITNSWANSKTFLKMYNKFFRSTWEAYFYIYMMKNNIPIEYEKLRIKYFDSTQNKERTYITDFIDYNNKILYEIKPYCYLTDTIVLDKEKYAKEWCKNNGYKYVFITEEWFRLNYNSTIVFESDIDELYKQKINKALNFKKDNNEKNRK